MTAVPVAALPPWSRRTVYALTVIVGGFTLGASGFELYSLARNAGFAIGVALALPIGLDAGAAGAAVLWVVGPRGSSLRRQGKVTTLLLVAVSAVCNGVSVLAVPFRTVVGEREAAVASVGFVTFLAFFLAFVFPLVAARAVHLLISVRDNAQHARPDRNPHTPRVPALVPIATAQPVRPTPQPTSIAPDMAAIEAPATGPATDPFPTPTPVTEDETVTRLRALRAAHGWQSAAKERDALKVGWTPLRNARETLDKENP